MKIIISIFKTILLFLSFIIIYSCSKADSIDSRFVFSNDESSLIKLAVYIDYGTWDECKETTEEMLKEMRCNYTIINKDSILNNCLNHYDLLYMTAGNGTKYKNHLGSDGMENIVEYTSQGGGYIGICGGAYFAASKTIWRGWADEPRINYQVGGLGIFDGIADGPIEDFAPSYEDKQCKIKITDTNHAISKNLSDIIEPYYHHGPVFIPYNDTSITVIGKSLNGNHALIVAFEHNEGKVVLSSAHPEWDDKHSSWEFIKNSILWCSGYER